MSEQAHALHFSVLSSAQLKGPVKFQVPDLVHTRFDSLASGGPMFVLAPSVLGIQREGTGERQREEGGGLLLLSH